MDIERKIARLSVAALAPVWEVPGKRCRKIAVLNDSSYRGTVPDRRGASAFGGGVVLTADEVAELSTFSAKCERHGSRDARLLVPSECMDRAISWFLDQGSERWMVDIAREITEEAFLEGTPVFDSALFPSLNFIFDRFVRTSLIAEEIRSAAAAEYQTTYLWWIYRVHCTDEILQQIEVSDRVILPTEQQVVRRKAGQIVLSATLAY